MKIQDLMKPIPIDSVEFRIANINKGGYAKLLAYKDARVDINRLNSVVGQFGWKREHTRDNANCIVSIWDTNTGQWISKEDTGTESYSEAQKGLASDSFKRACFNWGIGLELYDYPDIQIKLNKDEFKMDGDRIRQTFNLKLKEWKWESEFASGKLVMLRAFDQKGVQRYEWMGELPEIYGETTGKKLDAKKIRDAAAWFKGQIDKEGEPDYVTIQHAVKKLSNDEFIAVQSALPNEKAKDSNRQYKNVLIDIYKTPVDEKGKPLPAAEE